MPGWAAVVIAVTGTLLGLAIEAGAGHKELGAVFAGCFAVSCVGAALAVRQSALFTAVVQPPLLLFAAIPLAYYLFHSGAFQGLKDGLITCGYPLIERFPLMLFTTAAVLLVGLVRWYIAMSHPAPVALEQEAARPRARAKARPKARSGLGARITAALAGNGSEDEEGRPAKPRHAGRAKRPEPRTSGRKRPERQDRPASSGARHRRPLGEDELPPRTRREPTRQSHRDASHRDFEAPPSRRRPRPDHDTGSRAMPPPPPPGRAPRQRPPGYDPHDAPREARREYPREPWEPRDPRDAPRHARPTRAGGSEPPPYPPRPDLPRYPGYPPPPQAPRRRPAEPSSDPRADPRGGNPDRPTGTHHPVSRVRYRGSDRDYQDDNRR